MIDLHFDKTPNCWKIGIMLEETGIPYRVVGYEIMKGDHLTAAFGAINPNRKVPAIVDHDPEGGGEPVAVAESAAILIYLAEKVGAFLPTPARERAAVLQWLTWQISGLGPMIGQASHFIRYAPERSEYSIKRYSDESRRLMAVLDTQLGKSEYVAGEYSIADMAIWPWAAFTPKVGIGVEMSDHPNVARWVESIESRPAVTRVFSHPDMAINPAYLQTSRTLTPEEWSNIHGEKYLAASMGKN
jgi:GSH-dependent disulfide-bond oxidoreductase